MDEIMFPGSGKGRGRRGGKGQSLPTAASQEQEDLFGKPRTAAHVGPVARSSDPETSHEAARKAGRRLGIKQLAVLDLLQRVVGRYGEPPTAITDEAMIRYYGGDLFPMRDWYPTQPDSGLRTRRSELVTLGYVEDSGRKGLTAMNSPSICWGLTPSGIALDVEAERARIERTATRKYHDEARRAAGEP